MDLAIYLNYDYDASNPTIRLRRLNIRKPLRKLGINADIITRFEDLAPFTNVLISHFDKTTIEEVTTLRKQGKRIFFDHSENLWGLPYQNEVFNLCDYIICCSSELAELTQARLTSSFTRVHIIPDMAEGPFPAHFPADKQQLTVVFTGMGGNSYLAKDLRPIVENAGMKLVIISEWADADIKWNRDTYMYEMARCDIAICPQNVELQPAKSNVKVVTAMSLGLPIIASPLRAYKEIIKPGENGFIASSAEEWRAALEQLKSAELRRKISQNALRTASNYTPEAIAKEWRAFLSGIASPLPLGGIRPRVAFINNSLRIKYLSYGDKLLEDLRFSGYDVTCFRYEDIEDLPTGYDAYVFIEVRYNTEKLADVHPRILITRENTNINNLIHFDLIVCDAGLEANWKNRGYVNVTKLEDITRPYIDQIVKLAWHKEWQIESRKMHNLDLHNNHIDSFHSLQLPEQRWDGGTRDKEHIRYTMQHAKSGMRVLDVGSADGWLLLYLAKQGCQATGLEFVDRGLDWTDSQAKRLGVSVETKFGFLEEIDQIFEGRSFDLILAYEILEHVDYLWLPWYLEKMEKLLAAGGKILVSLPDQDANFNSEHLWSPNLNLIEKVFTPKKAKIEWVSIPNHEIPGNWFISYEKI